MEKSKKVENLCGKCDKFQKKPFTTVFECTKYNRCLKGKPPVKCRECIENEQPVSKHAKKEYIEVR